MKGIYLLRLFEPIFFFTQPYFRHNSMSTNIELLVVCKTECDLALPTPRSSSVTSLPVVLYFNWLPCYSPRAQSFFLPGVLHISVPMFLQYFSSSYFSEKPPHVFHVSALISPLRSSMTLSSGVTQPLFISSPWVIFIIIVSLPKINLLICRMTKTIFNGSFKLQLGDWQTDQLAVLQANRNILKT